MVVAEPIDLVLSAYTCIIDMGKQGVEEIINI